MMQEILQNKVCMNVAGQLTRMGVTSRYKGFIYIIFSVQYITVRSEFMYMITKDVYPYVADIFTTSMALVEHNIRTVICKLWEQKGGDNEYLNSFFEPFVSRPTNTEFVNILIFRAISSADTADI